MTGRTEENTGPQNIRECFLDYADGKLTLEKAVAALERLYEKRHGLIERTLTKD